MDKRKRIRKKKRRGLRTDRQRNVIINCEEEEKGSIYTIREGIENKRDEYFCNEKRHDTDRRGVSEKRKSERNWGSVKDPQ